MAIRTSAGTGVIVSLVVFVLLTVLLAVLSILLWGRLREAQQSVDTADQHLGEYASASERTADWMDQIKNSSGRSSVVGFLHDENGDLKGLLGGTASESTDSIRTRLTTLGLSTDSTAFDQISMLSRKLAETKTARSELDRRVITAEGAVSDLQGRLADVEAQHEAVAQAAARELEPFRDAESRHDARLSEAIDAFKQAEARTKDRHFEENADLEDENDELRRRNTILTSRLTDLESLYARDRIEPTDPSLLSDGRVIEIVGSDRVYIDRGRQDHVVLGMTFEIYDDAAQIRPDEEGRMPRGKASVQVLKVGETTSTAKITRSDLRQPVLANDVIANAIYDPNYTFKFMVHGKFDLNQDEAATDEEAGYLRDRIQRWGAEVVEGDALPGDLDFLVLGQQPVEPDRPQGASLSPQEWQDYTRKRQVYETYQNLLDSAREARVPVLNQHRLDILTGRAGH